jgi:hypothetical protein
VNLVVIIHTLVTLAVSTLCGAGQLSRYSDLLRTLAVQESNPVAGRDFSEQYRLVLQPPSGYRVIPGG